jgi:hypothetical protein
VHPTDNEIQGYMNSLVQAPKDSANSVASHISSCEMCQRRLQRLREFRSQLERESCPSLKEVQPAWEAIEDVLDTVDAKTNKGGPLSPSKATYQSSAGGDSKVVALKRKVNKLSAASVVLAACLALVIVYPVINSSSWFVDDAKAMDSLLASTIAENNELQRRLSLLEKEHQFQRVGNLRSKHDLQMLDKQIQLAYLEEQSSEHKILLWEQRKNIILSMLEQSNKTAVIII